MTTALSSIDYLMVSAIMTPLAGAVLAFLVRRKAVFIGVITVLSTLAVTVGLARQVLLTGTHRHAVGGWIPVLSPDLYVDGLSALMLVMTSLVATAISCYAIGYFRRPGAVSNGVEEDSDTMFWPLWLLLLMALNALFQAADAFNLYVALELLTLSAVGLTAFAAQEAALAAALRYLFASLIGSLSYLFGVGLLYATYATVDLATLGQLMTGNPTSWLAMALMTAGLIMKSAIFPMHFWLPQAHANAVAPVSAALSGLVVKASYYLLLRLWFWVFPALITSLAAQLLGALGACAILWGSIQALRQSRLKNLIAYSTISKLGYLFLIFPLARGEQGFAAWNGALLFAVAHAMAKAAMFLSSGSLLQSSGHDRLHGQEQRPNLPLIVFGAAAVGIIGLPPSGGFLAKWMLLQSAFADGQWWWVVVIALGTLLAAWYVAVVFSGAFRPPTEKVTFKPVPRIMHWSALSLAVCSLLLGLFAWQPLALLQVGAPFSAEFFSGDRP